MRAFPVAIWLPGSLVATLVAVAVASAYPSSSPLSPTHAGGDPFWAWLALGSLTAAFALYLAALALLRRRAGLLRPVLIVGVVVQLLPLAGPVLLSTDVFSYWAYGRVALVHGENPYAVAPADVGAGPDPAVVRMGAAWRGTTSVYGPGFTLLSEAHAAAVGRSPRAAELAYRGAAAAAAVALLFLAASLAARPAFAVAFIGWNPLLALHLAGGGHNDALMAALALAALALARSRRLNAAGVAWAAAVSLKWVPLLLLPLRALEAHRTGRSLRHTGFAAAACAIAAAASWRYGLEWLKAFGPLAQNAARQAEYSLPGRAASLGLGKEPALALAVALFLLAYLWLAREAWRGRARLGLCMGLALVATPWLAPWYAVWAVPLAAVEEDRLARLLALALSGYLLRDTVPV